MNKQDDISDIKEISIKLDMLIKENQIFYNNIMKRINYLQDNNEINDMRLKNMYTNLKSVKEKIENLIY